MSRRMVLSDAQQYFLQVMMNKGVIDQYNFKRLFGNVAKKFELHFDEKQTKAYYSTFLKEINEVIRNFNMEIKAGMCEISGISFYCFTRQSDASGIGKLSTLYTPVELKIFKKILVLIMESDDGYMERSTLMNQIICDDSDQTLTQSARSLTTRDIRLVVDKFVHDYWLAEVPNQNGMLTLHGRALIELQDYLTELFEENILNTCLLCSKIVLCGVSCDHCSIKLHYYCGKKYFEREKKCPNKGKCTQVFADEKIADFLELIKSARDALTRETAS